MNKKKARLFATLVLSVLFIQAVDVSAEPIRTVENLRNETVILPSSAPNRSELSLLRCVPITQDAEVLGWVALQDDPKTKRPADYLELYDGLGNLLLVGWIDQFGISRTAVDGGLLGDGIAGVEGILFLVSEGISS